MKIEQIYTGCLAQGAYYIESDGEAAIIDPLRETDPYVERAKNNNAKIKYIFETHFHADFVSGHVDLANKTGATIVFGPSAKTEYEIHEAKDGEIFTLGKIKIKLLHTPGHTLESSCYLLYDEEGKEYAIFTGDTLFIGDVGRPDLAVSSSLTKEDLAGKLFDSLRNKIIPLPDHIIIYPAHGAGSACGKKMSEERQDTLGNQKETNYALQEDMTKEEFIKEVTTGILEPPAYFAKNAQINKTGYEALENVMGRGLIPLSVEKFEALALYEDALVLDTRTAEAYSEGAIPGSIFIGLDGSFAPWVGTLIEDINQKIIFLSDEGREEEVVIRLARVGYENVLGYLKGGVEAWKNTGRNVQKITRISPADFYERVKSGTEATILDVRRESEFATSHVENAVNFPLDFINRNLKSIDNNKSYMLHCAGGYRSMITASILKKNGIDNFVEVRGGFNEIKQTDVSLKTLELA